jgi:hypothetical protein
VLRDRKELLDYCIDAYILVTILVKLGAPIVNTKIDSSST